MASSASDFRRILESVATRPGMWLPDRRYATLAAFVIGYNHGCGRVLGTDPKQGFQGWVSHRFMGYQCPIWWVSVIANHNLPGFPERSRSINDLTPEEDETACRELLALLDAYLAEIDDAQPTGTDS